MDPASLIPQMVPIPVPWAWFDTLLVLTFVAHILLMNMTFGSGVIALWHSARGRGGEMPREVARAATILLALTINLGVAPLLFLQVGWGHYDYVSTVLMGYWWLAVVGVLLVAYYGFYIVKFGWENLPGARNAWLFIALAGMLYVGFMFSNNMTIMLRPEIWGEYLEDGTMLNLSDPAIYPRFLHFMTAALAVGGLFIAILAQRRGDRANVELGMDWFTKATIVNLGFGLWFLLALPTPVMLMFLGQHVPATVVFVAALACAGMLIFISLKKRPLQTAGWLVLMVLLMATVRHFVRVFYLLPMSVEKPPVTGQYSPMVVFLVALAAGLACIAWMLRLATRSGHDNPEGGEA